MKKLILILSLVLLCGLTYAVDMQVSLTASNGTVSVTNIVVTDFEPIACTVLFKTNAASVYLISFKGKDAAGNVVGKRTATFSPAEAAMMFPQLPAIMQSVDAVLDGNKEMIIQRSR